MASNERLQECVHPEPLSGSFAVCLFFLVSFWPASARAAGKNTQRTLLTPRNNNHDSRDIEINCCHF